jgi:hypothetical protein
MAGDRGVPRHTITARHEQARDDHLDAFFLQATSQIDGLRHRRAQGHGFYDAHPDEAVGEGSPTLGVQLYQGLPREERVALRDQRLATGFAQRTDFPRWLWEHRIAAFATDTFAVERLPPVAGSDFADTAVDDAEMMHQELIARLGMPLGELWNLHALVLAARADRRWESFVVAKPLHLTGGVGSPANATAVRGGTSEARLRHA